MTRGRKPGVPQGTPSQETKDKLGQPSIARAEAQYIRSCDTKVGKHVRITDTDNYNEILDLVDGEK